MQRTLFGTLLVFLAIVGVIITGSFASPTAEIVRDASINVDEDPNALVKIDPSTQYDIVKVNAAGETTISPTNVGATSYNENMLLRIGDPTNPTTDYAFKITSLNQQTTAYTFRLSPQASYSSTADSVTFTIANEAGSTQTITADGTTTASFTLQPSEVVYIAIEYDTQGEATGNLNTDFTISTNSTA